MKNNTDGTYPLLLKKNYKNFVKLLYKFNAKILTSKF